MIEVVEPVRRWHSANGGVHLSLSEYGEPTHPFVILIHGIGNRSDAWLPVIPALAASFRVVTMDLRGHGRSDQPAAGYHHADYAADLQAVIEDLGVAAPMIVGHSLGGIVALEWAVRHPDVAAAIVAEDAPLSTGPGAEATFATWISMNAMPFDALLARYQSELPHLPDAQVRSRAESMAGTASAVFQEELAASRASRGNDEIARLAAVTSPVLLIHGDVETGGLVPPVDAQRFVATVPNGRVARIVRGTHSMHRDRPADFIRLVVPFLREHAPAV